MRGAMIRDAAAVVLCGGRSRRMGRDKASVKLAGRTLLDRALDIVRPLFAEVFVGVRAPRAGLDCAQAPDAPGAEGPIAGVATALAWAKTPWLFVLACDMPFVSRALIGRLARARDGRQAVAPLWRGVPQPLVAFYSRDALPAVRRRIERRAFSLMGLLDDLDTRLLPEAEWPRGLGHELMDIDTPDALRWANARFEERCR